MGQSHEAASSAWSRYPSFANLVQSSRVEQPPPAAELDVTEHMVSVRVRGLSPLEKQTIEQIVERTEGAA